MHVTWRFRIKELQASRPLFNITYPQVLLLYMKKINPYVHFIIIKSFKGKLKSVQPEYTCTSMNVK